MSLFPLFPFLSLAGLGFFFSFFSLGPIGGIIFRFNNQITTRIPPLILAYYFSSSPIYTSISHSTVSSYISSTFLTNPDVRRRLFCYPFFPPTFSPTFIVTNAGTSVLIFFVFDFKSSLYILLEYFVSRSLDLMNLGSYNNNKPNLLFSFSLVKYDVDTLGKDGK